MARLKNPPSRINRIVTGLDDFVVHRASRPLWVFAWTLFIGAIWLLVTFYISAAETQAGLDRERATLGDKTSETVQVRRVYDTLVNAWSTVAKAGKFYHDNLAGRSTADRLPTDVVSQGLKLSADARQQLAEAIGTISAVRFADAQLAAHSDGLREDLENADKTIAAFEDFFKTYSAGDVNRAVRQLQSLDQNALGAQREAAAALTRARTWPERADVLMTDLIAETDLLNARQFTSSLKFYGSYVAAVYVLGFLAIGFRVWQSGWKDDPSSQKTK